jgi:catechol 2,3-dioxygenase-like lactoylglutathione lyase family enzyme
MIVTYTHTNILARDPARLAKFYVDVFGCTPSGPERHLVGEWLGRGMGLSGARMRGFHLLLPGHGDGGPTLEIFELEDVDPVGEPALRRAGLMHLAFSVDDIEATLGRLIAAGGTTLGEISEAHVEGVGVADFVYARDPEGNIVELQGWKSVLDSTNVFGVHAGRADP